MTFLDEWNPSVTFLKAIVIALVLGFAFATPICYFLGAYSEITYSGEVIAYESYKGFYPHTSITLKTYSESSIKVTFDGHIDIGIGDTIEITTKNAPLRLYPELIEFSILLLDDKP